MAGGTVLTWQAQSKDDIIHARILDLIFHCIAARGMAHRTRQKTGKISQSQADEFIAHVLTLYSASDVLANVKKENYKLVIDLKNNINERFSSADKLFFDLKTALKVAGIFKIRKSARLANPQKGQAMMIGTG